MKTNKAVSGTVHNAVDGAVFRALDRVVSASVDGNAHRSVGGGVWDVVRWIEYRTVQANPHHPALKVFLIVAS